MNEYLEASLKSRQAAGSEEASRSDTFVDKLQREGQLLWLGASNGAVGRLQESKELLKEAAASTLVAGGIGILSQKYKPVAIVASGLFRTGLSLDLSTRFVGTSYALADTWQHPESFAGNSRLLEKTVGAGLVDFGLMAVPSYSIFKGLGRYCDVSTETLNRQFAAQHKLNPENIPTLRQDWLTDGKPTFTDRLRNPQLADLYDEHRRASVRLHTVLADEFSTFSKNGSGFFVDGREGLIATSYHVASARKNLTVYTSEGEKFSARLIARDRDADLAILAPAQHLAGKEFPQVRLAASTQIGESGRFYSVGHPQGVRPEVLSIAKFDASTRLEIDLAQRSGLQTYEWSEPDTSLRKIAAFEGKMGQFGGSSGSAMFNDTGEVIGVFGFGMGNGGGGTRVEHLHSLLKAVKEVKNPEGWLDVKTSARLTGEVNSSGLHEVEVDTLKVSSGNRLKLAQTLNQRSVKREIAEMHAEWNAMPSLTGEALSALGLAAATDITDAMTGLFQKRKN